jgi:hypothetical protein
MREENLEQGLRQHWAQPDGYMAPEGMTIEHWDTPEYKNWGAKWGALMGWILNQVAIFASLVERM